MPPVFHTDAFETADTPTVPRRSLLRRIFPGQLPSAAMLVLYAVLQVLIVMTAFLGGYLYNQWSSGEVFFFNQPKFKILSEAYQLLEQNAYFQLPDTKKLEYGMIKGMLAAYDEPHTVFVEPPQHELQTQRLNGRYGGIGVRVERDAQNYVYLYPLPDSPATKAGVHEGDRLIKVEALLVTPETDYDEIQAAIRGPVGSQLKVTIGHSPDFAPLELSIERKEMAIPSTTWNLMPNEPRVGVIHVRVIADTTPKEVTNAINELKQRGASHFILDVRNNGGGLVNAGVNMARLFLKQGMVIEEQYRGKEVESYKVDKPGQFADLSMVVLVNKGTASAAEIFAGALQGQKRALVVGSSTYGKDTIQLVFSLSDGSSLHVTAAHWWIPGMSNRIGGKGLQPDIALPDNASDNTALQKAVETLLK